MGDYIMWGTHVGTWLGWLTAGGAPRTTLELRRYQLGRLAKDYPNRDPWALDVSDLSDWLAKHDWSRETLRSYRAAFRSFYGWAHAIGLTDHDPARLLRKVPATIGLPRPASEDIVSIALAGAPDRVWLMLMLGSRHGLRRGEIAVVSTRDLRVDGPDWSLLVHGKGGKERIVPLLVEVARIIRDRPPGWVFPNGLGSHLTPSHVGRLLGRAMAHQATPHQLRHRFASRTYQATHDIRVVQELLGHASVATTQVYTAVADGALRAAVRAAAS